MELDKKKISSLIGGWWMPVTAFLASLAVYVATLPQTFSFEDSAEFVTAAATLGVPHPSGYPLYVILAWPFTKLPFGTVSWRVALFSALTAAVAVFLFAVISRNLVRRTLGKVGKLPEAAILAMSLFFACSEIWWSQAIYAKVYALHVLLTLAVIWAGLRWTERPEKKCWAIAAGLALGLGLSNHLFLTVLQVPFFLLFFWMASPDRRTFLRTFLPTLAGVLAGLLPYIFIYLRAASAPYAYGNAAGISGFFHYVLRLDYADVGVGGWNRVALLISYLKRWLFVLGPFGIFLVGAGVASLWRSRLREARALAVLLVGLSFSPVLLAVLRTYGWSSMNEYISRVYCLAAIMAGFLLAAVGAVWLVKTIESRGRHRHAKLAVAAMAVLAVAAFMGSRPSVISFGDGFSERYVRAVLQDLPPRSVLLVNEYGYSKDTLLFGLAYLQTVEKMRPDVTVIQDTGIRPFAEVKLPDGYPGLDMHWRRVTMLRSVLADERYSGRPIFATFLPAVTADRVSSSDGVVASVRCAGIPDCAGWKAEDRSVEPPAENIYAGQPALTAIVAHVQYMRAAHLAANGEQTAASKLVVKAIAGEEAAMSDDYNQFVAYRTKFMK